MKKIFACIFLILASAGVFANWDNPTGSHGAMYISKDSCWLFNGDGYLQGGPDLPPSQVYNELGIATRSPTGMAIDKCVGQVDPPSSGRAVVWSPNNPPTYWANYFESLYCVIPTWPANATEVQYICTNSWHQTISASGKTVLTCTAKGAFKCPWLL